MNRSQFVFVILVNALFTLLISSAALLIYDARRTEPAFVGTPPSSSPPEIALPTVPAVLPGGGGGAADAGQPSAAGEVDTVTRTYTVREGDSLGGIAQLFGVSQVTLAAMNGITNPNLIIPGQTLVIPSSSLDGNTATGYRPVAADFSVEILNAGQYAEEVIVIINRQDQGIDMSNWMIATSLGEQYRFGQMPPLFGAESVRLFSRAGSDTSYDKYWGRVPAIWVPGTVITLHSETDEEVLRIAVP